MIRSVGIDALEVPTVTVGYVDALHLVGVRAVQATRVHRSIVQRTVAVAEQAAPVERFVEEDNLVAAQSRAIAMGTVVQTVGLAHAKRNAAAEVATLVVAPLFVESVDVEERVADVALGAIMEVMDVAGQVRSRIVVATKIMDGFVAAAPDTATCNQDLHVIGITSIMVITAHAETMLQGALRAIARIGVIQRARSPQLPKLVADPTESALKFNMVAAWGHDVHAVATIARSIQNLVAREHATAEE